MVMLFIFYWLWNCLINRPFCPFFSQHVSSWENICSKLYVNEWGLKLVIMWRINHLLHVVYRKILQCRRGNATNCGVHVQARWLCTTASADQKLVTVCRTDSVITLSETADFSLHRVNIHLMSALTQLMLVAVNMFFILMESTFLWLIKVLLDSVGHFAHVVVNSFLWLVIAPWQWPALQYICGRGQFGEWRLHCSVNYAYFSVQ